jgi:AraC-like DNA-binding protein
MTCALDLRQRGFNWLDVVSNCGFFDQAHLINDFKGLLDQPPDQFFRMISGGRVMEMTTSLTRAIFSNRFAV